jgi:hypothetical protein
MKKIENYYLQLKDLLSNLTNKDGEMENKMLIIKTNGDIGYVRFEKKPSLKQMQDIVGGYIEITTIPFLEEQGDYIAIVNEEGMLNRLPVNHLTNALFGAYLYGDIIIMKKEYLQ